MNTIESPKTLKEELLNHAWKHCEEDGYQNLSLREVARRSGVSHNAPYRHFSSKLDILDHVAHQGFVLLLHDVQNKIQNEKEFSNLLLQAALAYIQFSQNHPQIFELMFGDMIKDGEKSPMLLDGAMKNFSELERMVSLGYQQSFFKKGTVRETCLTFWSFVHGLSTLLMSKQMNHLSQEIHHEPLEVSKIMCRNFIVELSR